MRDFVVFFHGGEGTSALLRLLDNFERIAILHQVDDRGWEPFDRHNCGKMRLKRLERCLNIVFGTKPIDSERLNQIYTRAGALPLEASTGDLAVGFKMRFRPPRTVLRRSVLGRLSRFLNRPASWVFTRMMFRTLRRNHVVVFVAVRQDLLRWALSLYHGDGTGKPGHLQFRLARGEINRDDIDTIHVDCSRLDEIVADCEASYARKRLLIRKLERAGIRVQPLLYETFLADKHDYFGTLFDALGAEVSQAEIDEALDKGSYFTKVHSDEIADFVENHQEVEERFGDRFVAW